MLTVANAERPNKASFARTTGRVPSRRATTMPRSGSTQRSWKNRSTIMSTKYPAKPHTKGIASFATPSRTTGSAANGAPRAVVFSPQGRERTGDQLVRGRGRRYTRGVRAERARDPSRPDPFEEGLGRCAANHAPLTPSAFLARAASVYPQKPAVLHGERVYTYAELYARARRLTSALARRGIG